MVSQLSHRGPDGNGYYHDAFISMGHTRLSIMDLSDASVQPFVDSTGRYILVYNGEIYNFRDVKRQLPNYNFSSEGDTEVLMAAFATWGIECVIKFKGIFAFALWDTVEQILWLARDRMGVKPLYFTIKDNTCVFGSEIRSILASGLVKHNIDTRTVVGYLQYQSAGYPSTFIQDVHEIPPGSYAKISPRGSEFTTYYKLCPESIVYRQKLSGDSLRKDLFCILSEAVASRLQGVVPVGAFLSGGIDSAAVVALASLHASSPVNTFTLTFEEERYDESKQAEEFSRIYRTNHHSIKIHPDDCQHQVSEFLSKLDSPSLDGLNTYLISSAAAKFGMKVMLSGLGGDELFAGYPGFRHAKFLRKWKFLFDNTKYLRMSISSFLKCSKSPIAFSLYKILSAKTHHIKHCYPALRQMMSMADVGKFTSLDYNYSTTIEDEMNFFQFGDNYSTSNYSLAELNNYAANTLLRDNDQMGMANSLEIREPFFDQQLVEFMLGLPDDCKQSKYPKQLLIDTLSPLLPDTINRRPKKGFVLPMDSWMRGSLFDICDKAIRCLSTYDFIDSKNLNTVWKQYSCDRSAEKWTTIWSFVVLGAWLQKNNIN
jgi:asparagine synthase (glutamine-hydrolysing)